MYQQLFEPDIKIPHTDFKLFESCNNAHRHWEHKQDFYKLKNELLEKYADRAGCDKQIIKRTCNACNGTGTFHGGHYSERCNRCDDGIYAVNTFYLRRYVLNGKLFHRPVDVPDGPIVETIKGWVIHNKPEINPEFSYACLLKKYKPDLFTDFLRAFRKRFSRADMRKWGEIARQSSDIIHALAVWHEVTVDDLPF